MSLLLLTYYVGHVLTYYVGHVRCVRRLNWRERGFVLSATRECADLSFMSRALKEIILSINQIVIHSRGVESFAIYTINFSIHGRNKRFFNKLYEVSRAESSIYVVKIT